MWPFKRRKKADTPPNGKVPQEVKDYYQAERREHLGMAWLLAFISLIVTMAVVIGLFFGGRWIYRKLANKPASSPTTTTQKAPATTQKPAAPKTTPAPKPHSQPTPSASSSSPSASQPAQSSPNTSAPTSSTPATPATPAGSSTPAATSQPAQNLSNTGPGNTVAIFVGVSAVGTLAHATYRRRKLSDKLQS